MGQPFQPSGEGGGHISGDTIRGGSCDTSVLHLHLKRLAAIKARSFDLHEFSWKKPANCQRLEASLSEPFLLPSNREAILGGKVAEGRKTADIVRIGKQPHSQYSRRHQLLEGLAALFHREPQFRGNLGIVRSLTGFHQFSDYDVISVIQESWGTHGEVLLFKKMNPVYSAVILG
jgi:hypothetical protein